MIEFDRIKIKFKRRKNTSVVSPKGSTAYILSAKYKKQEFKINNARAPPFSFNFST